jgi:hypothetical protein
MNGRHDGAGDQQRECGSNGCFHGTSLQIHRCAGSLRQ